MMSELGVKLQATKRLSVDAGPVMTVPFLVNHTNSEGLNETERFPAVQYNWHLGLGYSF
jgi:hypothetical protein